ncbi:MAG: chemotaxis protein CheX [Eubacteriales bacterium]|nr:chemotaxis protein CheX [Eubacteriales bacterium]MDD3349221.1 chemotaxis protein CheX [Eubacteriales bacterium]
MNKEYIAAFSSAYLNIMPQFGVADPSQVNESECGRKIASEGVACIVGIVGDLAGNVIYSMNEEVAKKIASYMMGGMEVTEFDEITQSAISELSNMLAANTCIWLSEIGKTLDISTPTLMYGEFTVSGSYDQVCCLEMSIDGLAFYIYISLEERN